MVSNIAMDAINQRRERAREATRRWRARRAAGAKLIRMLVSPKVMALLVGGGFLQPGVTDPAALRKAVATAAIAGIVSRRGQPTHR